MKDDTLVLLAIAAGAYWFIIKPLQETGKGLDDIIRGPATEASRVLNDLGAIPNQINGALGGAGEAGVGLVRTVFQQVYDSGQGLPQGVNNVLAGVGMGNRYGNLYVRQDALDTTQTFPDGSRKGNFAGSAYLPATPRSNLNTQTYEQLYSAMASAQANKFNDPREAQNSAKIFKSYVSSGGRGPYVTGYTNYDSYHKMGTAGSKQSSLAVGYPNLTGQFPSNSYAGGLPKPPSVRPQPTILPRNQWGNASKVPAPGKWDTAHKVFNARGL